MAADSIPRKIIDYLQATLPAGVNDALYYDAVARRRDSLPVCIVTACPSIPDTRAAGRVDRDTRSLVCYITLLWDARGEGRNYDDFEEAINAIADAVCEMQGTSALGSQVLQSRVSPEDCETEMNIETNLYIAALETHITFTR